MTLHGEVNNEAPELVLRGSMQAGQKQVEWPLFPVFWKTWGLPYIHYGSGFPLSLW